MSSYGQFCPVAKAMEVLDERWTLLVVRELVLGSRRFGTDVAGFKAMTEFVKQWPDRVWAIEGCNGIGRHIAMRLIAASQDVVDVPPKLSARTRVFSTGQGRKTDATDAHSVALVGTRMSGLRPVVTDEQLEVLRLLVDRRRSLGEEHTRKTPNCTSCSSSSSPAGRSGTCPRPKPRRCWPRSDRAMSSARPAAGSPPNSSRTSSGSTPGRRKRTRSSPTS